VAIEKYPQAKAKISLAAMDLAHAKPRTFYLVYILYIVQISKASSQWV